MRKSTRGTVTLAIAVVFTVAQPVLAHPRSPFPPPNTAHDSVRGRVTVRNGLLRNVHRERWGNGIQPTGAAVLTGLFNNFALIATAYLTGRPVSDGSSPPTDGDQPESGTVTDSIHERRLETLRQAEERADLALQLLHVERPVESADASAPKRVFTPESTPRK